MVLEKKQVLEQTKKRIFSKRYRHQILATLVVQILSTSHGISIGWLSPTLPLLQSDKTPLNFSVSIEEASWIGSFYGLGSILANIVYGYALQKFGIKPILCFLSIPHLTIWILIYSAQNVTYLYFARLLSGITAGGVLLMLPLYISQIADPDIRGALASTTIIFISIGILLGFTLSSELDYHLVPCIIIALPIIYFISIIMLPETTQYLIKKNKIAEAEKSYKFYKNIQDDIPATTQESNMCLEFDELKMTIAKDQEDKEVGIRDFLNKPALKAFCTAFLLIIMQQLSGTFAFVNYMSDIFAKSGSTIDPNTCAIIAGVMQIVGACIGTTFVDLFGRKILLMVSGTGLAVCLLGFGTFVQFASPEFRIQYNWILLLLMSLALFIASIGVIVLIFVIIVELLPKKIRSTGMAICIGFLSSMVFVALKLLPIFLHELGVPVTMFICTGVCVICLIYFGFFLEETKGKSMDFENS